MLNAAPPLDRRLSHSLIGMGLISAIVCSVAFLAASEAHAQIASLRTESATFKTSTRAPDAPTAAAPAAMSGSGQAPIVLPNLTEVSGEMHTLAELRAGLTKKRSPAPPTIDGLPVGIWADPGAVQGDDGARHLADLDSSDHQALAYTPTFLASSSAEGSRESSEQLNPWDDVTGTVHEKKRKPVSILQIGDSHTAADFFTGEVRDELQARYGDGGAGYMDVGTPHAGVHSTRFKISASAGWTYSGIQTSSNTQNFALSGFSAKAAKDGERLNFDTDNQIPYTDIEVEVQKGPDQGTIEIEVDGRPKMTVNLQSEEASREVIPVANLGNRVASLRRLQIKTLDSKPVTVFSVGFFNRKSGVTYSNIGFPGATVDILNKFPQETIINALQHLSPKVVVLAFGTNEGFNDNLDIAKYEERYLNVINTIRAGAPLAKIVMIGPSYANRVPSPCIKDEHGKDCTAKRTAAPGTETVSADQDTDCPWPTPPQLDRVRELQRRLAASQGIDFWDWSKVMPKHCGAQAWVTAEPRLMTADHVHFTKEGYRKCGHEFVLFLEPLIRRML